MTNRTYFPGAAFPPGTVFIRVPVVAPMLVHMVPVIPMQPTQSRQPQTPPMSHPPTKEHLTPTNVVDVTKHKKDPGVIKRPTPVTQNSPISMLDTTPWNWHTSELGALLKEEIRKGLAELAQSRIETKTPELTQATSENTSGSPVTTSSARKNSAASPEKEEWPALPVAGKPIDSPVLPRITPKTSPEHPHTASSSNTHRIYSTDPTGTSDRRHQTKHHLTKAERNALKAEQTKKTAETTTSPKTTQTRTSESDSSTHSDDIEAIQTTAKTTLTEQSKKLSFNSIYIHGKEIALAEPMQFNAKDKTTAVLPGRNITITGNFDSNGNLTDDAVQINYKYGKRISHRYTGQVVILKSEAGNTVCPHGKGSISIGDDYKLTVEFKEGEIDFSQPAEINYQGRIYKGFIQHPEGTAPMLASELTQLEQITPDIKDTNIAITYPDGKIFKGKHFNHQLELCGEGLLTIPEKTNIRAITIPLRKVKGIFERNNIATGLIFIKTPFSEAEYIAYKGDINKEYLLNNTVFYPEQQNNGEIEWHYKNPAWQTTHIYHGNCNREFILIQDIEEKNSRYAPQQGILTWTNEDKTTTQLHASFNAGKLDFTQAMTLTHQLSDGETVTYTGLLKHPSQAEVSPDHLHLLKELIPNTDDKEARIIHSDNKVFIGKEFNHQLQLNGKGCIQITVTEDEDWPSRIIIGEFNNNMIENGNLTFPHDDSYTYEGPISHLLPKTNHAAIFEKEAQIINLNTVHNIVYKKMTIANEQAEWTVEIPGLFTEEMTLTGPHRNNIKPQYNDKIDNQWINSYVLECSQKKFRVFFNEGEIQQLSDTNQMMYFNNEPGTENYVCIESFKSSRNDLMIYVGKITPQSLHLSGEVVAAKTKLTKDSDQLINAVEYYVFLTMNNGQITNGRFYTHQAPSDINLKMQEREVTLLATANKAGLEDSLTHELIEEQSHFYLAYEGPIILHQADFNDPYERQASSPDGTFSVLLRLPTLW